MQSRDEDLHSTSYLSWEVITSCSWRIVERELALFRYSQGMVVVSRTAPRDIFRRTGQLDEPVNHDTSRCNPTTNSIAPLLAHGGATVQCRESLRWPRLRPVQSRKVTTAVASNLVQISHTVACLNASHAFAKDTEPHVDRSYLDAQQ